MRSINPKRQQKLLEGIEQRRAILENAVMAVVKGFTSALFVWGPPGLGKSHLLTVMLDGIAGKTWRHHTAHSTPKALFMSLLEEPNAIHLYEDCEQLLKTLLSASILRAACGAPNERERWVSYETANETLKAKVTGGIIIATNADMRRTKGELQGVASRFRPIRWDMTLEERIAMILDLASRPCVKNGVELEKRECVKVAHRLIEMATDSSSKVDLDLRLFTEHALPAFAQAKVNPGMAWEDLLQAKLIGVATTVDDTQADRTRKLQALAQKIDREGGSIKIKLGKWKSMTELGQAIYYRHLRGSKIPTPQE